MSDNLQHADEIRKNMARTGLAIALVAVFLNFYDGERIGIIAAVLGMAFGYFSDLLFAIDYEDDFSTNETVFNAGAILGFASIAAVAVSLLIWLFS